MAARVEFSRVQHAFFMSAYQPDSLPLAVINAECSCSHVNVRQLQRQTWTRTATDRTAGTVKMLHLLKDMSFRQCVCVCVYHSWCVGIVI